MNCCSRVRRRFGRLLFIDGGPGVMSSLVILFWQSGEGGRWRWYKGTTVPETPCPLYMAFAKER